MEVRFEEDTMANSYKWWICVVCSDDYHTYYSDTEVVKARSAKEAMDKVSRDYESWRYVEDVFGPFKEEPQRWEV